MQDESADDATSAAELRRKLDELERRFLGFLATAADWCWEADAEGRLTWLSRESILPPDTLVGRTRWEAAGVDPAAEPAWRAHLADLRAGRPFRDFQYALSRPDGRPLHCSVDGNPLHDDEGNLIGWRGTGRDVTELKRRQAELEASERRFRDLIEGSLQGVLIVQGRRFVYVNQALCRMFGYSADELLAADRWLLVAPEDLPRLERSLAERPTGQVGFKGRRKDGALLWLECLIRPIEWSDAPAWQVVIMDVTERRRAEEQFRQAQRMEAVGQLTGGVAHDFNNLLAVVLGNLDLIREANLLPPTEARMLESATAAATRGARLTRSLLAFARRQQLNPERCDVNALAERAAELFARMLGETIQIETRLAPAPPAIVVDPAQLEAALLNLAVNARDAMPTGGRITIETAVATPEPEEGGAAGAIEPGGYVMLSVTDSGTGMTPEVRERAFEPFFTTKEVGKGTGLGLSMVYGFVKQSGGQVRLRSEPGIGSIFELYLPRAVPSATSGLRVLVVADDAEVRATVLAMLESLGCVVRAAADGADALRALAGPEPFDVLLTDVTSSGGLSGVEIAEQARRLHAGVKVLFTTGYAPQAMPAADGAADAAPLSKPFRRADLAQALARLRRR